MKYKTEVTINLSRERVLELFDNSDNMLKWQEGLIDYEYLSGEPGQPGAKMKLNYDMNGRKVEMIETITTRNFPDEFSGTYEASGVYNIMANYFHEEGLDKTRWVTVSEFQFSGMMKLIGFFMRGSFPKQTLKTMNDFKHFAEKAS